MMPTTPSRTYLHRDALLAVHLRAGHQIAGDQRVLLAARNEHALMTMRLNDDGLAALEAARAATTSATAGRAAASAATAATASAARRTASAAATAAIAAAESATAATTAAIAAESATANAATATATRCEIWCG